MQTPGKAGLQLPDDAGGPDGGGPAVGGTGVGAHAGPPEATTGITCLLLEASEAVGLQPGDVGTVAVDKRSHAKLSAQTVLLVSGPVPGTLLEEDVLEDESEDTRCLNVEAVLAVRRRPTGVEVRGRHHRHGRSRSDRTADRCGAATRPSMQPKRSQPSRSPGSTPAQHCGHGRTQNYLPSACRHAGSPHHGHAGAGRRGVHGRSASRLGDRAGGRRGLSGAPRPSSSLSPAVALRVNARPQHGPSACVLP